MKRTDITDFIKSFLRSTSGATAIEYALIAGGIAIAIVGNYSGTLAITSISTLGIVFFRTGL